MWLKQIVGTVIWRSIIDLLSYNRYQQTTNEARATKLLKFLLHHSWKFAKLALFALVFYLFFLIIFTSQRNIRAAQPDQRVTAGPGIILEYTTTPGNPIIASSTPSPSPSPTPTLTGTPTLLPTEASRNFFVPFILKQPTPTPTQTPTLTPTTIPTGSPSTILFCNSENIDIPDDEPAGISSAIAISDPRFIVDLDVRLAIEHTWVGDLAVALTHLETGKTISLIDRPGVPENNSGCGENDIASILDDELTTVVEDQCAVYPAGISGIYRPEQPLSPFIGDEISGNWLLTVSDHYRNDVGQLAEWCIAGTLFESPIPPTPTPEPPNLPDEAFVSGVTGKRQSLPLDCESRSAVDWANYYGESIDEMDFFYRLPESENPDDGFVGNVYGAWGQIPPAPYGVHAEPVAKLLRDYGLDAYAHRPLSWDDLRAEIAAGHPVIAWIVGATYQGYYDYVVNGIPIYYHPPDDLLTIVARYEHTVIITGYTNDRVTYLNGASLQSKNLDQFLSSWSTLGNMAITTQP